MNNVNLLGRLTRDVEIMYTQNGVAIGTFTLAVNRKFKNKQDEYEADFIRCKAFKKTAEIIAEYVKKGHQLAVSGNIQTGSFENKEGQTVFTTDVIVNEFTFAESRNSGKSQNTDVSQQSNTNTSNAQQNVNYAQRNDKQAYDNQSLGEPVDIDDQDLPF